MHRAPRARPRRAPNVDRAGAVVHEDDRVPADSDQPDHGAGDPTGHRPGRCSKDELVDRVRRPERHAAPQVDATRLEPVLRPVLEAAGDLGRVAVERVRAGATETLEPLRLVGAVGQEHEAAVVLGGVLRDELGQHLEEVGERPVLDPEAGLRVVPAEDRPARAPGACELDRQAHVARVRDREEVWRPPGREAGARVLDLGLPELERRSGGEEIGERPHREARRIDELPEAAHVGGQLVRGDCRVDVVEGHLVGRRLERRQSGSTEDVVELVDCGIDLGVTAGHRLWSAL